MRMLDLFSGIGGFSLSAQWTGRIETVAFCEIDPYCQKVLAKNFPGVPIHSDVRALKGSDVGPVDIICGGFPCQPFSVAGKQRGAEDDRHLWPEMLRVIAECRPCWVVGENVAGFIPMGLDNVLSDLEGIGYEGQAFVVPACAVDAAHRRDRVWIVAHAEGQPIGTGLPGCDDTDAHGDKHESRASSDGRAATTVISAADADRAGRTKQWRPVSAVAEHSPIEQYRKWPVEPGVGGTFDGLSAWMDRNKMTTVSHLSPWDGDWELGIPRVAHGVPNRVARLKGLGNAIVPQVAYEIMMAMLAANP